MSDDEGLIASATIVRNNIDRGAFVEDEADDVVEVIDRLLAALAAVRAELAQAQNRTTCSREEELMTERDEARAGVARAVAEVVRLREAREHYRDMAVERGTIMRAAEAQVAAVRALRDEWAAMSGSAGLVAELDRALGTDGAGE